jgi:hypothetical protein
MPKQCCVDTWNKIPDDEPVFVIRGKDLLALKAVGAWIESTRNSEVPKDKIDRAQEHYQEIKQFQKDHPERCKMPD